MGYITSSDKSFFNFCLFSFSKHFPHWFDSWVKIGWTSDSIFRKKVLNDGRLCNTFMWFDFLEARRQTSGRYFYTLVRCIFRPKDIILLETYNVIEMWRLKKSSHRTYDDACKFLTFAVSPPCARVRSLRSSCFSQIRTNQHPISASALLSPPFALYEVLLFRATE